MRIKFTFLLMCFAVFSSTVEADDEVKRGLYFQSFEVDKDQRTCLNLNPKRPFVFIKGFSMEFDVKLRRENQSFGYIFRIICNDTVNVDLLTDISTFSLVIKNRTVIQYRNWEIGDNIENTWIKVLFVFDPVAGSVSLSLNGREKKADYSLIDLQRFNVYFGKNMHGFFSTTDIAPMIVKDIRIFDEKNKLARHWELAKHSSNGVYDECVSDMASALNPVWEIDNHLRWSKRKNLNFTQRIYGIAFCRNEGRLYFAGDSIIYVYNTNTHEVDVIEVLAGAPFNFDISNQIIYDPNREVLLSYDFEGEQLAVFDFFSRQWNNNNNSEKLPRHLHHGRLFIPEDSLFAAFGGYGYHRYNSLFYKCRVADNIWDMTDLSAYISPRYLGAMGRLEDRQVLFFGGLGNESGLQIEFPRNYYDLYTINIDNIEVKKIWELPNPAEDFTNSNSLVVDRKNGKFYALAYPNKRYVSVIKLHKYSLDKPEYRVLGDSIPYFFNDIESFCDLFQSADNTELYAITSHVKNNATDINIYSISFPPMSQEEIMQRPPVLSNNGAVWFLLVGLLIGLTAIFMVYRKRKPTPKFIENLEDCMVNEQTFTYDEEILVYENLLIEKRPSSISLLGNFHIVNNEGYDIAKNFTSTTTQLFLLILLSTINNGHGSTSKEIWKMLWYDKDEFSAKNNRGVYVNKLRAILKSFEEIRITNDAGYWKVQFEKNVFCDYERVLVLIKTLQAGDLFNKKMLTELLDIALKGTLLPYTHQTEWLEPYQTQYTNMLIECLMKFSTHEKVKTDLLLLLKIADVILLHDSIDEDAITLKCRALFQSGRKSQALQAFNRFTADFEKLLAEKHNLVFEELVK